MAASTYSVSVSNKRPSMSKTTACGIRGRVIPHDSTVAGGALQRCTAIRCARPAGHARVFGNTRHAANGGRIGRRPPMTRRRFWVYFLLFLFNMIAYTDRVNMSVAGKPIADELGLSPVALGYLFSSFLWAYVLMMLPGGRLIDRWGAHVVASVATAVWSAAQMATGVVGSFIAMLMVRLGLGVGEAPFAPISYSSVRLWSPYTERGTAIAAISCGSSLGLALGAPAVAWLIERLSWRWSFIITGAVGFVWVAVWLPLVSTPEKTRWVPPAER